MAFRVPPGVTKGAVADTITVNYNDLDALKAAFEANKGEIAAVIVEPIAGNMGVVPPEPGYLQGLRDLCTENGTVLIFDEVISGFRASLGGAVQRYGVQPDMCCFGKIIGGGFPVGAFAGKAEIMDVLAPEGPVYQAGTLSGNPVAMEAGLATLNYLQQNNPYDEIERLGARLEAGLLEAIAESGVTATVNRVGSVATIFFTDRRVVNWDDAATCDTALFARWFTGMLDHGFMIAPSQYEALFLSAAHTEEEIDAFIAAAKEVLKSLA